MTIAKQRTKSRKTVARGQPKAQRRASLASTRTVSNQPDMTSHANTLDGLSNPFSEFASSARYPDAGSGRTLTTQQRYTSPVTSDATGQVAFVLSVKPNFPMLYASGILNAVATWPATYASSINQTGDLINTYGSYYRPTSFGAKFTNTLSATNSQGSWVVAKAGSIVPSGTTTFNPNYFSTYDVHPNAHGEEGHWHTTSHPRGGNSYAMAKVSDWNTNTVSDQTWESIYIYGTGLPASATVGVIEIIANFEYSTLEDAPIASLAVRQPTLDIGMQTAVNAVQSTIRGSHKGTTDKVRDAIKREGKKALLKHVLPFLTKKATQVLL